MGKKHNYGAETGSDCAGTAATRYSGNVFTKKCFYFHIVFKEVFPVYSVSYCFFVTNGSIQISDQRLTVAAYGHNLVPAQTQHLVSGIMKIFSLLGTYR